MTDILSSRNLQRALDGLAKANNRAQKHRDAIYEYCEIKYGCTPGEIAFDMFIDNVDGGCGVCLGMSVSEFNKGMELGAGGKDK